MWMLPYLAMCLLQKFWIQLTVFNFLTIPPAFSSVGKVDILKYSRYLFADKSSTLFLTRHAWNILFIREQYLYFFLIFSKSNQNQIDLTIFFIFVLAVLFWIYRAPARNLFRTWMRQRFASNKLANKITSASVVFDLAFVSQFIKEINSFNFQAHRVSLSADWKVPWAFEKLW